METGWHILIHIKIHVKLYRQVCHLNNPHKPHPPLVHQFHPFFFLLTLKHPRQLHPPLSQPHPFLLLWILIALKHLPTLLSFVNPTLSFSYGLSSTYSHPTLLTFINPLSSFKAHLSGLVQSKSSFKSTTGQVHHSHSSFSSYYLSQQGYINAYEDYGDNKPTLIKAKLSM